VKAVRASGGDEGTCLAFAERMAGVFKADNPRFDAAKFYEAADYEAHVMSADNASLTAGGSYTYPMPKAGE
jgi:hypothetical protein